MRIVPCHEAAKFSTEFHIENGSNFDELGIEVRNQTKLKLVWYDLKVYQIENLGFDPALCIK